jgi:predicted XRE-type DNA-binding protein
MNGGYKMPKRFERVSELVNALSGKKFAQDFDEHSRRTQLSRTLFVWRNRKDLTQTEVAGRVGCKQAKISKLEHAEIQDMRMKDVLDYLKALGLSMSMQIHEQNFTATDAIKYHALEINRHLEILAAIAKDEDENDEISGGIADFFGEYFQNSIHFFTQNLVKLPQPLRALAAAGLQSGEPTVQVSAVPGLEEEEIASNKLVEA